ncbi:hypothetical protein Anas_07627, partial [Armadillidium nasatum]
MDFSSMGPFALYFLKSGYKRALWAQGLSRHSDDEVQGIIRKDLEAISIYLGQKPYLMGDTVTEVDCALFGVYFSTVFRLGNFPSSPFPKIIKSKISKLGII